MTDGRPTKAVILPSYNSGPLLVRTARKALLEWPLVWVVIDGSTDSSAAEILLEARSQKGLHVLRLDHNQGKGAAVLAVMREAQRQGVTHGLVMDADGQHPASSIREFMALSNACPGAMILGVPVFGPDAPRERVFGRRIGNTCAELETLGAGVRDSLFGFRLYPIERSLEVMAQTRGGRRFDFDTEIAVRLLWARVRPINRPVPVTYPPRSEGGVTHFRYLRDNFLLACTHLRLCLGLLPRLPRVLALKRKWRSLPETV